MTQRTALRMMKLVGPGRSWNEDDYIYLRLSRVGLRAYFSMFDDPLRASCRKTTNVVITFRARRGLSSRR